MNRADLYSNYKVENDRIVSPGKFEGEPIFAPYFWELGLEGFADLDTGTRYQFKITKADASNPFWPELKQWLGRKRTLCLSEDSQGFVRCH